MVENVIKKFAPQMSEYLDSKPVYAPYLMQHNEPGCDFPSFSTDEHGFRKTYDKKNKWITLQRFNQLKTQEKAALIGNSTAFGVGATSDISSLTSLLCRKTDLFWFNFSGRTFQSTQEMFAYLLFSSLDEKHVVILSGINNFDLSYRWFNQKGIYLPPFYCQNEFDRRFQVFTKLKNIKDNFRKYFLLSKLFKKNRKDNFFSDKIKNSFYSQTNIKQLLSIESINRSLLTLKRDLTVIKNKSNNLYYLIQPIAEWLNKELSKEEKTIFQYLKNRRGKNWELISSFLKHHEFNYRNSIKHICSELEIKCFDLNELDELKNDNWIFLDRYHLSDLGQMIISDYINSIIMCP